MADKKIRIHIGASTEVGKIHAVNVELARLAMSAGRQNEAVRQSALRAARGYYDLGGAAEESAKRSVLSAKQIEEAWRKAMARPAEEAAGGLNRLSTVARSVAKGIGGQFARIGELLASGGIWGVASMALTSAFSFALRKVREDAEREAKRAAEAWKDGLESIKEGAAAVEEAYSRSMSSIDKAVSRFDAMTDSVKELTKAEIELAKQRAIAGGMGRKDAERAAADLSAQVDDEAEERRLKNLIEMERRRVDEAAAAEAATVELKLEATKRKEAAEAEYQRKREEYVRRNAATLGYSAHGMGAGVTAYALSEEEVAKNRARAAEDFEGSDEARAARGKVKEAEDQLKSITTDEKALAAADDARRKIELAKNALASLGMRREAREQSLQNELAAEAEEEARRREEADARAAEARRAADVKAAQEAAKERERLDRELHQRRMADLREEIAEQQKAAAPLRAAAAAAQGEFERAFGMYRDPSRAAAEIAEEKSRAEDLDRLHADARRYGGSWRIDELSRLMAAGDAQGQADALASWRKSSRFTPEVEAMVRASAAERTKTTAEDELRKIEANTAGLAAKLDELLQVKG